MYTLLTCAPCVWSTQCEYIYLPEWHRKHTTTEWILQQRECPCLDNAKPKLVNECHSARLSPLIVSETTKNKNFNNNNKTQTNLKRICAFFIVFTAAAETTTTTFGTSAAKSAHVRADEGFDVHFRRCTHVGAQRFSGSHVVSNYFGQKNRMQSNASDGQRGRSALLIG